MSLKRLVYESLGYSRPAQQEFFVYEPLSEDPVAPPSLIRGAGVLDRSYEGHLDANTERMMESVARLCRYVPFVEGVFLVGPVSFGVGDAIVSIAVIANTGRTRMVSMMMKAVVRCVSIWRKRYKLPGCTVSLVVDRHHIGLHRIRTGVRDVYSVLWLAHWSMIYQQYAHTDRIMFEENQRLRYYLPSHPLQSCINVGVAVQQGTSRRRNRRERLLGGVIGSSVEAICYHIGSLVTKNSLRRCETGCYADTTVGGDEETCRRVMIHAKLFQKSSLDS